MLYCANFQNKAATMSTKKSTSNLNRLFKALNKNGLDVVREENVFRVRLSARPELPFADILLPSNFQLEGKAAKQLASLASVSHPEGGEVTRAIATPDIHPGYSGIAIGSVIRTERQIIPQAIGSDINCGMRFHTMDLDLETFMARRDIFVEKMKGDYFFGTRDVTQRASTQSAMFAEGLLGWHESQYHNPIGSVAKSDWSQLFDEIERAHLTGSLSGSIDWAPDALLPDDGVVRDGGLATIGGGNHFVELQVVHEIYDRKLAFKYGIKEGQLAFMVHTGSRLVGKHIGRRWIGRAKNKWPKGLPYPDNGIFAVHEPEQINEFFEAQATAANYGFVNRMLLAELLRLRIREIFGEIEAPLLYDLPHNIALPDDNGWITRKGACPANADQPVIIPGSMGASSFFLEGLGNNDFLCSASHGAGRSHSRQSLYRKRQADLGLTGVDCITLKEERKIEEAPVAYKPIQPVIDIQVKAGIVRKIARMEPILTFKS